MSQTPPQPPSQPRFVIDCSQPLGEQSSLVQDTAAEIAALQATQAQLAALTQAQAQAASDRAKLVAALQAGSATPEQVQAALAALLSG